MAKCRNLGSLTMCPSFHVTREERHSTRGRARLLFEMLKGDPITDGWRDDAVKESLDLCLSCKGCTGDCPVQVDIPTYKAEFLVPLLRAAPAPAEPLRARAAAVVGAGGGARAPARQRAHPRASAIARQAKRLAGIAEERDLPRFATETFRDWHRRRQAAAPGPRRGKPRRPVGRHVHQPVRAGHRPGSARGARGGRVRAPALATRAVLRAAAVRLRHARHRPSAPCSKVLDGMSPSRSSSGWPVVVLEPSCASVFRDELRKLLPHDEHARRLVAQTFTLDEFLERHAPDWEPPGWTAGR